MDLLDEELFFLKVTKCKFKQRSIDYLGITITDGTIHINPTKRKGLASWPRVLTTLKQLQSTLGVLGYQQPFIKGFAAIAKLLTNLLKKGKEFIWTKQCTKALDNLLGIVESDPVLHQLDHECPFEIEVDASQYAIGAILYQ